MRAKWICNECPCRRLAFAIKTNPLPWMNSYLVSDNVQVAPQETEISSYLVGQVDSSVDSSDFAEFEL